MQAMKGATMALGSMNRSMNLPALQRIAMEFERENDIMEQRQEMMDDAVDDAMDTGLEEEGDEVVEQVLEEIGVDLNQAVSDGTLRDTNHLRRLDNLTCCSSVKRLQDFRSKRHLRDVLPRRSVGQAVVEAIPVTMIFKPGLIASGSNLVFAIGNTRAGFVYGLYMSQFRKGRTSRV